MSWEWPPCLASADVYPGKEDFLRSSYSKFLDILCLPHLSCMTFAKLGERFAQRGMEGVCNKVVLTDFGLVWIMDVYGYYILDGLFGQEKTFIWRDFALDLWNLEWILFAKV